LVIACDFFLKFCFRARVKQISMLFAPIIASVIGLQTFVSTDTSARDNIYEAHSQQ